METIQQSLPVLNLIEAHEIEMVRVSFSDVHGVSRGRHVPIQAYLAQIRNRGMEFSNAIFAMDTSGGIAPGTSIPMDTGFPNWKLVVDETTFKPLPWKKGEARVLADMVMPDGAPVEVLPRQVLKKVLNQFQERGFTAFVGTEYEFYLLRRKGHHSEPVPLDPRVQYNSELEHAAAMHRFAPLLQGLRDLGIQVEAFGEEYAPSQYEINLHYQPAVQAADEAFLFKQAVKELLSDTDVVPSFMSKPFEDGNGCGCHIHLSLFTDTGENIFSDETQPDGLSTTCKAFVGGILTHAPALMALTNPTINCYKRIVPGRFAPIAANWGYDNRNCVVRFAASRGSSTHLEYRAPSAISNPYVVIAAVLVAGLDGIERNLDAGLPETGSGGSNGNPPLPGSLGEALDALAADEVFHQGLGSSFVRDFIAIKKHEVERYRKAVTNWEWNEYVDLY